MAYLDAFGRHGKPTMRSKVDLDVETGQCTPRPNPTAPGPIPTLTDTVTPETAAPTAIKYDGDKVPLDLLTIMPFPALAEIGKVMEFGAKKYALNNWRQGFKWRRVLASMLRHIFAFAQGEDNDPESGLSHLAHAGCNVLFLLTFVMEGRGQDDDRYK